MDYRYVYEQITMIYEHVTSGEVNPAWLATHCQILSHYAELLNESNAQGAFFFHPESKETSPDLRKAV